MTTLPLVRVRTHTEFLLSKHRRAAQLASELEAILQECMPRYEHYAGAQDWDESTRQHLAQLQAADLLRWQAEQMIAHLEASLTAHKRGIQVTVAALERTWPVRSRSTAEPLSPTEQIRDYFDRCKAAGLFREKLVEVVWLDNGVKINGTVLNTLTEVMQFVGDNR